MPKQRLSANPNKHFSFILVLYYNISVLLNAFTLIFFIRILNPVLFYYLSLLLRLSKTHRGCIFIQTIFQQKVIHSGDWANIDRLKNLKKKHDIWSTANLRSGIEKIINRFQKMNKKNKKYCKSAQTVQQTYAVLLWFLFC